MPGLNLKAAQWEQQHKTHVEEYLRQIEALYDVASDELIRLGMGYKYQPNTGRLFAFSSNKSRSKQADASLSSFRNKLSTIITAGITSEWFFANDKNDSWVKQLFDNPKKGWMLHNLGALEAFQRRTTYGHNLSERVWSIAKQFERHIELSLSIGISEGRSAADISRDVRVYLNEPDKLFSTCPKCVRQSYPVESGAGLSPWARRLPVILSECYAYGSHRNKQRLS